MTKLERRLSAIESRQPNTFRRPPKRFITEAKDGIDPVEDLRARGHDVEGHDIVCVIIDPPPREAGDDDR